MGSAYEKKTIGYSSRFLAYGTLSSPDQRCDENVVVGGFHTIDFNDLFYHPITTSTTTKAGCPPYVNPRLSMPAELTDVDAAWKTCQPLFYGAFDPPRVLTKTDGPLGPVPVEAKPTPVSAAEPVLTSSQSTNPVSIPATQAAHIPALPTPTSNVQTVTPSSSPGANDPVRSSPSVLAASPSQAATQEPNVALPVQSQTSKDPNPVTAGQASIAVPAENVPGSLHQSTLPKPESESAQTTSFPQIVPVAVLPSDIAVSAQGSNPIVVLSKGAVEQLGNSPGLQPQPGSAGSGESHIGTNPDGQESTSGGNPTANNAPILIDPKASTAPIIIAMPMAPAQGSPGSGSQTQHPNLASPILFGLSGPTPAGHSGISGNRGDDDGPIIPNGVVTLEGSGSSGGVGDVAGAASVDLASPQPKSLQLAALQAPTALAIGSNPVALAPHGAVVVGSQTITPGQQAAIDGTSISVGLHSELVIGGTTHTFTQPTTPEAVASTIYAPTTQIHTLAAGAETTMNGIATTNTRPSAVIVSETTNVAITTAFFPSSEDQAQDPANIVYYSTAIREMTLQPGDSATLESNFITTNTASTPLVLSQTSSIPVSTILLPDSASPKTAYYSPSPITTTIPPGSVFTVSGSVATNLASGPLTLTEETNVPVVVSPITTQPSSSSSSGSEEEKTQIFEINGHLLTHTEGVYALSKLSFFHAVTTATTAAGSSGHNQEQEGDEEVVVMTLEIGDGATIASMTTVVTLPASLASRLQRSSSSSSSRFAAATTTATPFGSGNNNNTTTASSPSDSTRGGPSFSSSSAAQRSATAGGSSQMQVPKDGAAAASNVMTYPTNSLVVIITLLVSWFIAGGYLMDMDIYGFG